MNQLVRCINCDAIFLKTPFDEEPEYESPPFLSPYSIRTFERDDLKDFMKGHDGHRIEDLTIIEDSFVSDKDYIEPVKVSYFKATNGKENFVIRKFREKIGEPLRYEMVAGDYALELLSLEVQARDIARQLAMEFEKEPFSRNQVDSFIKLFEHIVKTVDVEKLDRISEESSNPLNVYYKLDDVTLMYLLRNCHHIFKGHEYAEIEGFIHRHKDDGVLLLKGTYKIQIIERAREERRAVSSSIPLERRKLKATL